MWEPTRRSTPEWEAILTNLEDTLDDILIGIEQGRATGTRFDIQVLDSLDELECFMQAIKRDLGV